MSDAPHSQGPPSDPSDSGGQPPVDPTKGLSQPPPPPGYSPAYYPPPTPSAGRGGVVSRVVTGLVGTLLIVSVLMNVYLGAFFVSAVSGPREATYQEGDQENRIVILPVSGTIDSETSEFIARALKALKDDPPKALILRVDSGGGSVSASDRIWNDLIEFKKETQIPVIASFGGIAASGGYYISAPCDYIMVEPTTITGSIGVIAQAFTVSELLDKLGVTPEIIAATEATKKDTLNPMRDWTEADREVLRRILDSAYDRFVDIVADGRKNMSREQVKQVATGEVFTSAEALENQLADGEGYLNAAIDKAKELAGIEPDEKPLVTTLSAGSGFGLLSRFGAPRPGMDTVTADQVRRWLGELTTPELEYRLVYPGSAGR